MDWYIWGRRKQEKKIVCIESMRRERKTSLNHDFLRNLSTACPFLKTNFSVLEENAKQTKTFNEQLDKSEIQQQQLQKKYSHMKKVMIPKTKQTSKKHIFLSPSLSVSLFILDGSASFFPWKQLHI